jgi:hypothetical protein
MIFQMQRHPRLQGVGQLPAPEGTAGAPRTVTHVVPIEQYAIQYFDETGVRRVNILIKVGDQLYFPPNGAEWAASLKPAAEWVRRGVLGKIEALSTKSRDESLPQKDKVDVVEVPHESRTEK